MNKVVISAEEVPLPAWANRAEAYIQKVLKLLGHRNWELSVLFCNNRYIKTLNARFRGRDEPTDVLSFTLGETMRPSGRAAAVYLAGDIVVSLDALEENARYFDVPADEELCRLLIHGILHLSGADHAGNEEGESMLKTQEEILKSLKKNNCANILENVMEELR